MAFTHRGKGLFYVLSPVIWGINGYSWKVAGYVEEFPRYIEKVPR